MNFNLNKNREWSFMTSQNYKRKIIKTIQAKTVNEGLKMEWRVIYLGKKGGGSQLTAALLECFDGRSKGIVSAANKEIAGENLVQIAGIPSGLVENILFYLRSDVREKVVTEILKETANCICIFVMTHPVDRLIKRKMKKSSYWTIVHDVTKHKGDFWPFNSTIKRLILEDENIVFLSHFVRNISMKKFKKDGVVLPLISPNRSVTVWNERRYDVAILGRHKRYKNGAFGLKVLASIKQPISVFISCHKKTPLINTSVIKHNSEIETGWLSIKRFIEIMSNTKLLLLTHEEASQSGLISMANSMGTYVIAPRVGGLTEQVIAPKTGLLVTSNSINDYLSAIDTILELDRPAEVLNNYDLWKKWSKVQGI
jgi:glycosyltransferase involved in cell wall biosynthesis